MDERFGGVPCSICEKYNAEVFQIRARGPCGPLPQRQVAEYRLIHRNPVLTQRSECLAVAGFSNAIVEQFKWGGDHLLSLSIRWREGAYEKPRGALCTLCGVVGGAAVRLGARTRRRLS